MSRIIAKCLVGIAVLVFTSVIGESIVAIINNRPAADHTPGGDS